MVGLLALFGCWFMIGLSFNFSGQSPLQSLETARDRWDATGIDNYKISLTFYSDSVLGGLHLTIQNDQIVDVAEFRNLDYRRIPTPVAQSEADEYVQIFARYGNFPAELNDYTIDNIFNFAAEKVSNQSSPLIAWCHAPQMRYETVFNEEYSYLQTLIHTNCPSWDFGGGWMCGISSHCTSGIHIVEFEPLS